VEDGRIRVGLKQIDGIAEAEVDALLAERTANGPFASFEEFCRRVRLRRNMLERMILSGCFDSLELNRKRLMWEIDFGFRISDFGLTAGRPEQLSMSNVQGPTQSGLKSEIRNPKSEIPVEDYTDFEKFSHEARILGINVLCHVMAYYREELKRHHVLSSAEVGQMATGAIVNVAGLLIRPHRPPTRSGRTVVFFSLEDEHGMIDVTVFENVYQRYGKAIYSEPALIVKGRVDRRGNASSVTAMMIRDLPRAYRRDMLPRVEEEREDGSVGERESAPVLTSDHGRVIRENLARGQSPGHVLKVGVGR
jgi:error-prone DNA polymerase